MLYQREFIDRIRREVPIESYISRFVPLQKRGKNLVGLCPFHQEKSPSFNVSSEKQFYHCFGCKASGDIFQFVMSYDKVDFQRAKEILSEYSGIPIQEKGKEDQERTELLYRVNKKALQFYMENLRSAQGLEAREYLKSRGIEAGIQAQFQLGFALPGYQNLTQKVFSTKEELRAALEVGLIRESEKAKDPYDFFRERIMFPVLDLSGRVIAFSGRILGPGKEAKYVNSPASSIFDKGRTFYHLYQAKEGIQKTRTAILVEGYLDVIGLVTKGFENVVACMGTAVTENHIRTMKKFADRFQLVLDGDNAGRKGALHAAELCLKEGMECSVVLLPEGKDPFDLSKEATRQELQKVLETGSPASSFVVDELLDKTDSRALPEKKRKALDNLYGFLRSLQRDSDREFFLGLGARKLGISMDAVLRDYRGEGAKFARTGSDTKGKDPVQSRGPNPAQDCERKLISLLVKQNSLFSFSEELSRLEYLDPKSAFLWDFLYTRYAGEEEISPAAVLSSPIPGEFKEAIAPFLLEEGDISPEEGKEIFDDLLTKQAIFVEESKMQELESDSTLDPLEKLTKLAYHRANKEKRLEYLRSKNSAKR
ncbi:DNA primase [Leptospira perolatii]|uniref:DNA primase n=1 Tax=Leptospira perolatii TaxID=2023191 RepID=A0A2M9ZIY1_9LEPT|nr:DNA primase [Leptospira perolatii]PJZ69501.1 DNA primase [Leptospira perolatii]PJZ72016.1 DNA primase [Leptospira perolatii]